MNISNNKYHFRTTLIMIAIWIRHIDKSAFGDMGKKIKNSSLIKYLMKIKIIKASFRTSYNKKLSCCIRE